MDDFEDFFAQHYSPMRRALTLAFGSTEVAEDAVQEAFIRACMRWQRLRHIDRPHGWVYVTAVNVARDLTRRSARRHEREQTFDVGERADVAMSVVAVVDVRHALLSLPPRQRAAVVLRYLADLTNEEVADAMGCSVGTVKSTLHSALNSLRIEMEKSQ